MRFSVEPPVEPTTEPPLPPGPPSVKGKGNANWLIKKCKWVKTTRGH